MDTKAVILEGGVRGGLYELSIKTKSSEGYVNICEKLSHFFWHCRLGHLNSNYMSILEKQSIIKSVSKPSILCNSCQLGKSHALPHPSRKTSYKPLDLVFSDIRESAPVTSFQGYHYYVNFVDVRSNFNWVFPMVHKTDIYQIFEKFKSWAER